MILSSSGLDSGGVTNALILELAFERLSHPPSFGNFPSEIFGFENQLLKSFWSWLLVTSIEEANNAKEGLC